MTTRLNLLAHEVENESGVDQEDSELVDNSLALVLVKPKTYVLSSQVVSQIVMAMNILGWHSLCYQQDFVDSTEIETSAPDETNSENNETSSPTNSEDYNTPPEHGLTAESRTSEGGNVLNRHYSTKLTKIQDTEGKCIYVRSTKRGKGKLIRKRSTKIGRVYTLYKRLKELFKSCQKPKYTPLAEVDVKKFKKFQKIL